MISTSAGVSLLGASQKKDTTTETCVDFMSDYTHSTASVEHQKVYAECVEFIHPSTGVFYTKILIVFVLFCMVSGVFICKKLTDESFLDSILAGSAFGFVGSFFLIALFYAVGFLIWG